MLLTLEIVIWKVPKPVPPAEHGYKYRAVYVVDGVHLVGYTSLHIDMYLQAA